MRRRLGCKSRCCIRWGECVVGPASRPQVEGAAIMSGPQQTRPKPKQQMTGCSGATRGEGVATEETQRRKGCKIGLALVGWRSPTSRGSGARS
jgi:hypothetical protein